MISPRRGVDGRSFGVAFLVYVDEDSVNRALIRALQARGMDVTNAVDAGQAGTSDVDQLEHAIAEGRVLFTYNIGDFFSLHTSFLQAGRSHAGLILAPQQRYSVGEQVRRILRMSGERSPEDNMQGRAEFLRRWSEAGERRRGVGPSSAQCGHSRGGYAPDLITRRFCLQVWQHSKTHRKTN